MTEVCLNNKKVVVYILRIAIIGVGGVGKAFLKLLFDREENLRREGIEFVVNYIANSKGGVYAENGLDLNRYLSILSRDTNIKDFYDEISFDDLLKTRKINFLVEMTPTDKTTGEPGMTYIKKALKNGINVVTSNKGPILLAYKRLKQLANENGVQLGIGCTTGGALPTINGGIIDLAGSDILSIEGVLNGTTNFIINEMEKGKASYDQALLRAQKLRIAETDPYLDVEGWDTAIKLLILTNVLIDGNKTLKDVDVKGITHITPEDIKKAQIEGKKYKLIGKSLKTNNVIKINVGLEEVGADNPFYFVDGRNKAVRYQSDTLGDLILIGGQSGVVAAAASVLRDIINIKRGYKFF